MFTVGNIEEQGPVEKPSCESSHNFWRYHNPKYISNKFNLQLVAQTCGAKGITKKVTKALKRDVTHDVTNEVKNGCNECHQ